MIYRPKTGSMWDASVIWHDGKYYAFMMYNKDGLNGLDAVYCFLATSEDGVHWNDHGIVNEERERERGCKFFKCFVSKCGERFIMNHGVARPEGQDTLRFYESKELEHWTYLFSNHPVPRWYVPTGRWDHMYILPKQEGNPIFGVGKSEFSEGKGRQAGYWGYPVATAKSGLPRGVGMMQSKDGQSWEVLPPAKVEWGDVPPRDLEWGGCEQFEGKYYLIGGTGNYVSKGYSMYVFAADHPRGAFRPQKEAYRLCGSSKENVSWLAAWCRGNNELLISNYASMEIGSRAPWMLPMRKPFIDKKGYLRLGWWKGNERLKGIPLPLTKNSVILDTDKVNSNYQILWLDNIFDLQKGVILEGIIKAQTLTSEEKEHSVGFVLDEGNSKSMAIQLGIGTEEQRETHIGRLNIEPDGKFEFVSEDVTGKGCATVTGIDEGKEHTFRLLVRLGGFELYIDDLLMQTYVYQPVEGKIGLLARNTKVVFNDIKAWHATLNL